jgi:hypothetical protein
MLQRPEIHCNRHVIATDEPLGAGIDRMLATPIAGADRGSALTQQLVVVPPISRAVLP